MEDNKVTFEQIVEGKRLGKAPSRSHPKMLNLNNYTTEIADPPKTYDAWKKNKPLPIRDVGNNEYGNCTIASQVLLTEYMERQEQKRTIHIPKENLGCRHYGCGDYGAYEIDALNNWRRPDLTFRDDKGRPYTIDAYVRINQSDLKAVKNAIVLSKAPGIKVCFNLPWAWAMRGDMVWDIPEGQSPTGIYMPGTWGGHSMMALDKYDENWLYLPHSWNVPMGKISWRAFSIYCDEAYMVIDSVNSWKKKLEAEEVNVKLNLDAIVSDVNSVSSQKIK
jgi:hypothetical protein